MLKEIFREYDIRGIFERDLNEHSVKAIGLALGEVMLKKGVKTLSLGYDARTSANALLLWLSSGLNQAGLKPTDIGLAPTPVGYFSVFKGFFDANIMITGSHNPKEYNGFKITIGTDSYFGKDLQELRLRVLEILKSKIEIKSYHEIDKFEVKKLYVKYLLSQFSHLKNLNIKFSIDCGNGAAGAVIGDIVNGLGLKADILFKKPDGEFPNHHPDPSEASNLAKLKEHMSKNSISLGFAFDGDADRIAVLSGGKNIKGDELAYLYSLAMNSPRILGEVKCSQNIYDAINKSGGESFMTKTGHSNIKKAMKELNIDLAAEVSGHIFFKERYFGFDDAIYAMLRVLELLAKGYNLNAELAKLPKVFNSDEIKINTTEQAKFKIANVAKQRLKAGVKNLPKILDLIDIDGVRVRFENGWALIRASNTTPCIIMRFEANSKEFLDFLESSFRALVSEIQNQGEKQ